LPEERVVLITGASSGIGKLTAELLADRGFTVFGTSRKASAGIGDRFETLQLDITSDESVTKCISSLLQKTDRIDVLINNAGQAFAGGLEETSLEEARAQFDCNFFGAVRMVNAVLPEMRRQRSGQIINLASLAAMFPIPFGGYYGAAKSALIAYSEVLRQEVKNLGVRVSVVEPGFFNTHHTRISAANSISDYDEIRKRAQSVDEESFDRGGDPKEVAEMILAIIENSSPRLHYTVGREKRYLLFKRILPDSMIQSQTRKHWRLDR
jgi:short-subunit dehydrogenase